jgi:hypothetical protein
MERAEIGWACRYFIEFLINLLTDQILDCSGMI